MGNQGSNLMFNIYLHDALDHTTEIESFETLEEAKESFEWYKKQGPEGYDLAIELEEVDIIDDETEDFISIDYHEWFTQEEWEAAHPGGFPESTGIPVDFLSD